ncbi:MAG: c-type cytochrome, partial [Limisphaerales bacterium]
ISEWGAVLADQLLASVDPSQLEWWNVPIPGNDPTNPWRFEDRDLPDGQKNVRFITSFSPGAEKLTGVLTSKPFDIPDRLKFLIAGHDGFPDKPAQKKNRVVLREAGTDRVLMEIFAPRNDAAQVVQWDLSAHTGKRGYFEVIDADTANAYAWIAVGHFEPIVAAFPSLNPNQIDRRQIAAAELAELLRVHAMEGRLSQLFLSSSSSPAARGAAAKALLSLNASTHLQAIGAVLLKEETDPRLRERIAQAIVQANNREARDLLLPAMESASGRMQSQFALALASNVDGAESLLQAVEGGKASARILQDSAVKDRMTSLKPRNFAERLQTLTQNLPPLSQEKQKLIEQRRTAFDPTKASVGNGTTIFSQSCAICHQLDGIGTVVGPQLDGVGNRGIERLLEDILDPNRNVDHAFRYSNVTLKDDQVITGLFRREEGETLIFADATGQEIPVAKNQIEERHESENSLMPDNFDEILSEQDLNDLLAFLLSKGNKPNP